MVEVADGAALARDIDQVRRAAMQKEMLFVQQLQFIRHGHGFAHVAAAGVHAALYGGKAHTGEKRPLGTFCRAARCNLAGFCRAVDFKQGRFQLLFCQHRELRRHGCGGRKHDVRWRDFQPGRQQHLQMGRRGDQHARAWRRGQFSAYVGRIKRVGRAHGGAALQGQQHRGL